MNWSGGFFSDIGHKVLKNETISGKLKGKKLKIPDKETRPLKDIVKESFFNIINHSNKLNLDLENQIF